MKKLKHLVLGLIIVFASCSKDEDGIDDNSSKNESNIISDKNFGGSLNGKDYTGKDATAFIEIDSLDDKEKLNVTIANVDIDCGEDIFNKLDHVRVSIPTSTKEVQELNVVVISQESSFGPSNNLTAKAQIVSQTETLAVIKVKTVSSAPADSSFIQYDLEGKITVEICSIK